MVTVYSITNMHMHMHACTCTCHRTCIHAHGDEHGGGKPMADPVRSLAAGCRVHLGCGWHRRVEARLSHQGLKGFDSQHVETADEEAVERVCRAQDAILRSRTLPQ